MVLKCGTSGSIGWLYAIEGEFVAEHRRNWGVYQWEMDLYHYIKTFTKKKGALAQSECLSQAPIQIKKLFTNHYIGKEKDFLELLLYVREKNKLDKVMAAVRQIETKGLGEITTEKLIFLSEQTDLVPAVPMNPDEHGDPFSTLIIHVAN